MAESQVYQIKVQGDGEVVITEEVVATIAGLAALETDGVASLLGGVTSENVTKAGSGKLAKCIRIVSLDSKSVSIRVAVNLAMNCEIPKVSADLQEKVKNSVETMTGLSVASVDVRIASVSVI